jgi:hypothetical protein
MKLYHLNPEYGLRVYIQHCFSTYFININQISLHNSDPYFHLAENMKYLYQLNM